MRTPTGPSTAEVLADRLRDSIVDGSLRAGAQLHQENLAEQYGVSRSPIREALRLLEARGLVTYYPNRGAVVTTVSSAQIRETVDIRRLLEPHLIELVAANVGDRDVAAFCSLQSRVESASEPEEWNALHRELHDRMYATADRPRMLEIVNDNRVRFSDLPDFASVAATMRGRFAGCDRDLLEGLARRDASLAVAATIRHLDALEESAMQRFRTE